MKSTTLVKTRSSTPSTLKEDIRKAGLVYKQPTLGDISLAAQPIIELTK